MVRPTRLTKEYLCWRYGKEEGTRRFEKAGKLYRDHIQYEKSQLTLDNVKELERMEPEDRR